MIAESKFYLEKERNLKLRERAGLTLLLWKMSTRLLTMPSDWLMGAGYLSVI